MSSSFLSIIVTHHKTFALLKLCLKNIKKYCNNLSYEIILTNSESSAYNSLFIKENYPEIKLVDFKENVGYSKLVNAGIKQANGNFILIVNADIIVCENSIKKLLQFMENYPRIGLVGPQLLNFNGKPQNSCFKFYTPFTILYRRTFLGKLPWAKKVINNFLMRGELARFNPDDKIPYIEVDWLMGSALMTNRSALTKVGLLDEKFFMYFEDVDWAKRFWEKGYKVAYFPGALMCHYHQKMSSKKGGLLDIFINKYSRIHVKSALRYFWKHGIKNLSAERADKKLK
ncbi:MAG: glycosyltransferase family 2 protein [Patescibacteria group bacterium]